MSGALVLETDRTLLRRVTLEDADALGELFSDPVVMKTYERMRPLTAEETLEHIHVALAQYARDGAGTYTVFEREGGQLIGFCGLEREEEPGWMLGYVLAKRCWGQGIATEVGRALIDYAFCALAAEQVFAFALDENRASRAVLAKLGLERVRAAPEHGARSLHAVRRTEPSWSGS